MRDGAAGVGDPLVVLERMTGQNGVQRSFVRWWWCTIVKPSTRCSSVIDTPRVLACQGRGRGWDSPSSHCLPARSRPSAVRSPFAVGTEASRESRGARVDARACAVHHDGFRHPRGGEDRRPLDGGPAAETDIGFPIGAETLQFDFQNVRARRQAREPELTALIRGRRQLPANQRR